jgi:hypothetical protein
MEREDFKDVVSKAWNS